MRRLSQVALRPGADGRCARITSILQDSCSSLVSFPSNTLVGCESSLSSTAIRSALPLAGCQERRRIQILRHSRALIRSTGGKVGAAVSAWISRRRSLRAAIGRSRGWPGSVQASLQSSRGLIVCGAADHDECDRERKDREVFHGPSLFKDFPGGRRTVLNAPDAFFSLPKYKRFIFRANLQLAAAIASVLGPRARRTACCPGKEVNSPTAVPGMVYTNSKAAVSS